MKIDYLSIIARLCTLLLLFDRVADVHSLDISKYNLLQCILNICSGSRNAAISLDLQAHYLRVYTFALLAICLMYVA